MYFDIWWYICCILTHLRPTHLINPSEKGGGREDATIGQVSIGKCLMNVVLKVQLKKYRPNGEKYKTIDLTYIKYI